MTNTHAGAEEYNQLMDAAGRHLSHGPTWTDVQIATLVSRPIIRSWTEAQEEGRALADRHVINTGIYQISCRNCAEAILNTILGYPYSPDPDLEITVNILAGNDEVFTRFTNEITAREAEQRRAGQARRGERVTVDPTPTAQGTIGMYINIC